MLLPRGRLSDPQAALTTAAIVCLPGLGDPARDWPQATRLLSQYGAVSTAMPASGPAIVIGHSQGALRALELAAARPERVVGLVLTSGVFPPARNGRSTAASAVDYVRRRVRYLRRVAAHGRRPRPTRSAAGRMPRMARLVLRPGAYHALADAVRCPVLVMHGDQDDLVPVDFARAAVARHPRWDYRELAGGGHVLQRDDAERWASLVGAWLEGR